MGAVVGRELTSAAHGEHIAGVMVFAGGLTINGSALVGGLLRHLPPGTPVSGGLAADGPRFERTWVHFDGHTGEDCVAAFAVLGQAVSFGHGSQGGWDGFGPRRTITASEGNVLYELDGQPALALYKQYLGDRADELPSAALLFPLTVWSDNASSGLVRTVLSVDEQTQSMTFAGDVPQGWSARLMWTSLERSPKAPPKRLRRVTTTRAVGRGRVLRGPATGDGGAGRGGSGSGPGRSRQKCAHDRFLQLRRDRP